MDREERVNGYHNSIKSQDRNDRIIRWIETFTNVVTNLIMAIGVVGGYMYFLDGIKSHGISSWEFVTVVMWWILVSGKFSQRNALRR